MRKEEVFSPYLIDLDLVNGCLQPIKRRFYPKL
jgi:hypothetical protein